MTDRTERLDPGLDSIVRRAEAMLGTRLCNAMPLPGGHSGVTLVAGIDGETPARSVVIKATPPGRRPEGRHDVLRQARVMGQVAGAVPVPAVLGTSTEEPPLFVMSFVDGEAAEPAHDPEPSGDDAALMAARFGAATKVLAALHRLDPSDLLVAGEPPATPEIELARWARTLEALHDPHFADVGRTAQRRLAAATPEPRRATLVHGDFRLGNVLFQGAVPAALIDWEIWSVGDHRLDLAWYLTFCDPGNFPGIGFPARRLPSVGDVVGDYEAATGDTVVDLEWFLAFGAFKMGVIMAHNLQRHRNGRHVDPFQERLPPTIDHLLAKAASFEPVDC